MGFVIPYPQTQLSVAARKMADWPMAFRFAFLLLPACFFFIVLALWLGYRASAPILHESLRSLPLLEAKIQAAHMTQTLKDLHANLLQIAQSRNLNPQRLREGMPFFFHDTEKFVRELGFKDADGQGFLLYPNGEGYHIYDVSEAGQGPYSPFQQILTAPLRPGEAMMYPVVYSDDPVAGHTDGKGRDPIMRMSLVLDDGSGVLVLGVSVTEIQKQLSKLMAPDSPLRIPVQNGATQLAFFFDTRGWIIFEMDGQLGKSHVPDLSRLGYEGDLGRAGYDAGFKPWALHDNYWLMITETLADRSGSLQIQADKYSSAHSGSAGFLCYAPVMFASAQGNPAKSLGGIAFFETSSLPMAAYMKMASYALVVILSALLILSLLAYRIHRMLVSPMARLTDGLTELHERGELAYVHIKPSSIELQRLQESVNTLISSAMTARNTASMLTREIRLAKSRLPVDFKALNMAQSDAEFGMVGSSPQILKVRELVRKAAKAGTDVLVWGETGTGKELIAAAIHKAGAYSNGPYVSLNCGALDENLLLDALFGHVKGAFTEARSDRKGAFLAADGGTLHLDEIANASLKVQQALLRALSVRRIRPLGTDEEVPFNTRVVAATNEDLRQRVHEGTFREDLYYRLAIISIESPPLRQRKSDLPELAVFCINEAAHSLGRNPARLSRGALELMTNHDWPGNVREFKNCITRAMAFVEGDLILRQHITLEHKPLGSYPLSAAAKERQAEQFLENKRSGNDSALGEDAAVRQQTRTVQDHGDYHYAAEDLWPPPSREAFTPAREAPSMDGASRHDSHPLMPDFFTQLDGAKRNGLIPPSSFEKDAPDIAPPARPESLRAPVLNERQGLALRYAREHGEITRARYESVAGNGVSARTAQNDLRELVELGILERQGAGPGTRYVLCHSRS